MYYFIYLIMATYRRVVVSALCSEEDLVDIQTRINVVRIWQVVKVWRKVVACYSEHTC